MAYTEQDWTAILPSATKTKLQAMDAGIKTAQDTLDLESTAGRAVTQAANAAAQRTALGLGNVSTRNVGTASTDAAAGDAPAAAQAAAEGTAAGYVSALSEAVSTALGDKVDKVADKGLSTNDFDDEAETKLGGISEGADVTADALAAAIEAGTETATPADTDIVPSISAAHAAQKSTWAQIKAAIVAGVKATAANIVTGTSDLLLITVKGLKDSLALDGSWLTKRTKMPDGATAVYESNFSAGTDSWSSVARIAATAAGNKLIITLASGSDGTAKRVITPSIMGKTFWCLLSGSKVGIKANLAYRGIADYYAISDVVTVGAVGVDFVLKGIIPADADVEKNICIKISNATVNDYLSITKAWIGDYSYAVGSLSKEAARINNLHADMPGVGVYASQTITATDLATATKGDTIGGKKYTFVAALTASPGVEGEILKEATKEAELENLNLAISEAARTNNGTKYWAAQVHPLVSSARVNAVLTLTAKTNNGTENAITVVCEAGTNHMAGGATLLNGYTDSAAKTIAEAENNIAGGRTRPAAAKMELTNTALIGYETTVDVASGGTLTLPAGGTWYWNVYGYGATISSAKRGSSAGGTTLTVAGANASVGYRRVA